MVWLALFVVFTSVAVSTCSDPSAYVINGYVAPLHAWPHQGAIKRVSGGSLVCGCLYLNEEFALTAAHCVVGGVPEDYTVIFGTNHIDGEDGGQPETRGLQEIISHEDFNNQCEVNNECYNHDIALLRFSEPLAANEGVIESIRLTDAETADLVPQECALSGWGRTSGAGPSATLLRQANYSVISDAVCETRLAESYTYLNHEYQECCFDDTRLNEDHAGPCFGDSGGPVQCRASPSDPWQLVGLANWMIGQCDSNFPAAWTKISHYRDWVCQQTGDNGLCL